MNASSCPDCSGSYIPHSMQYMLVFLNSTLEPLSPWMRKAFAICLPQTGPKAAIMMRLYRLMERQGWAELLESPDEKTLLLSSILWQEGERRGIKMYEFRPFGRPSETFIAQLPDGRLLDFEGAPLPQHRTTVWWINNKTRLKKDLNVRGIPTARGSAAATRTRALAIFKSLQAPVVVKPAIGSASRHTTTHIMNEQELLFAFESAKQISPFVIIEEELRGRVYRPTLVEGRLIATLRRDQPHVTGDAVHTVEQLVESANKHPARQGPYFSHLQLNAGVDLELLRQGATRSSIPMRGQRVELHQKINWSVGGTTTDVSEEVHPDNSALFEHIAQLLRAPLVGIDFIIEDISRSWKTQERCGVIECNDMPYFDNHHLPFDGKPRNVAGPVWDLIVSKG